MKIALISDMHGHAIALEAVLADIQQRQVDQVICLGDVATIGFAPQKTLALVKSLDCVCLMGNHDAALLQPHRAADYQIAPPMLPALDWCARQLLAEDFAFLRTFQPLVEIPLGGQDTMLCFHGSPRANTDIILATTPAAELGKFFDGRQASIWAGGHTHLQMLRQHNGMLILNPGSVGSSFRAAYTPGHPPVLNPWAEYAIVSWQADVLSVDCRRVAFDKQATREAIVASQVPNQEWWLAQYQD
ncbi:MAG: metallophosphoesterase [Anaerolineae bacterium]|nr:metallophosphoesterase [Anaerolineae bacterium]